MEVHICMRHRAIKCNFLKSSATSDDGHDSMRIYLCAVFLVTLLRQYSLSDLFHLKKK